MAKRTKWAKAVAQRVIDKLGKKPWLEIYPYTEEYIRKVIVEELEKGDESRHCEG